MWVWINKILHFNGCVTLRAEDLQVSIGDFQQVRDKISLAIHNEFQEIKTLHDKVININL